jgi:hypothetical protein
VQVLRGEPGVGKSSLLDYVAEHASGAGSPGSRASNLRWSSPSRGSISRACQLRDDFDALPEPQRDPLRVAFGIQGGAAPISSSSPLRS